MNQILQDGQLWCFSVTAQLGVMLQVGEAEVTLEVGKAALSNSKSSPFKRDILLAMALAHCSLASSAFSAQDQVSPARCIFPQHAVIPKCVHALSQAAGRHDSTFADSQVPQEFQNTLQDECDSLLCYALLDPERSGISNRRQAAQASMIRFAQAHAGRYDVLQALL